jgi:hypothetical protein
MSPCAFTAFRCVGVSGGLCTLAARRPAGALFRHPNVCPRVHALRRAACGGCVCKRRMCVNASRACLASVSAAVQCSRATCNVLVALPV